MTTAARPDFALAADLFARLAEDGFDGAGITRDSYGAREQRAHALIGGCASDLGLEVRRDAALNLHMTLPGARRSAPRVMVGSHLDSVPSGGNYDGAAGVVAGLAVLAGWRRAGLQPASDTVVIAFRAEESTWFPYSYLGSKAAFGMVAPDALAIRRSDSGRTLADHLADCGGDPASFGRPTDLLSRETVARFIELHIEQGPVLVEAGIPVGLVSGIRGSFRYREARLTGVYAHSGAAPRRGRRDAVRALGLLLTRLDALWEELEAAGHDLTVTVGMVGTNPARHAFSKVPGEAELCLDVRSLDDATLALVDARIRTEALRLRAETGVALDLGPRTASLPARMTPALLTAMERDARTRGLPVLSMASGAGHDAAVFATAGIPTAMIFVRNEHGSHNPDEAMAMDDFERATLLLDDAMRAPA